MGLNPWFVFFNISLTPSSLRDRYLFEVQLWHYKWEIGDILALIGADLSKCHCACDRSVRL